MTLFYIKQDDTIWGCGDPECCGEYIEEIKESFHECNCENILDYEDHLQLCNGGGSVLKWRKAKSKEIIAFEEGISKGWEKGYNYGFKDED